MGLAALATMGAVMMSPALGVYGNWAPMASIVGAPTPLVFLAALAVSLPTAISYALVNAEMPSAGSAFTWLYRTTGRAVGSFFGLLMVTYYTVAVMMGPILFGLYFRDLLQFFGVDAAGIGWWLVGVLVVTAFVAYVTYSGIQVSTRSAVVIIIIEMVVVLALSATILAVVGTRGEITLAPFNPLEVSGGLAAFGAAMIIGVLSYTGYDVISTVAEEARAPRRLLPRATLLATVGVGLFWAFNAWAFTLSVPLSRVEELTAAGLTAATPIAEDYWGWGRVFVIITALSAATGVYIATVIGASRGLYAMARDAVVPRWLSQLNPTAQVPWHAMHVVFGIAIPAAILVTLVLNNAVEAFVWWASVLVFFALVTYLAVNAANFIYFWRFARERFRWGLNFLVPLAGIALDAFLIYYSFFQSLWGMGWRLGGSVITLALVIVALAAIYVILARRRWSGRDPEGPSATRGTPA
jgi:amino acid transporter